MKSSLFDVRILALAAMVVVAAGCVRDACNNECAPTEVCVAALLACVPADSATDAGPVACETSADCTNGLPQCNTRDGHCVECLQNEDCPSGRCEPYDFSCLPVGCMNDRECHEFDSTRPVCAAGECVECHKNAHCPVLDGERRRCNFGSGLCIPDPCRDDAGCEGDSEGKACDPGSGLCLECTGDDDCPGRRCHVAKNSCVDCLGDSDCVYGAGETCRAETGTCVVTHCAGDFSCEGPQRCDASRNCVACLDDGDCAWGGVCGEDSVCAPPSLCVADSECPWPLVCAGSACVACRDEADCRPGQSCNAGKCNEPDVCVDSSACLAGKACQDGACVDVECEPDAFEPNDTINEASFINPGVLDASLCHNDVDLYALRASEGQGVEAVLTWNPADGTPRMELVAGLGGLVIVTPSRPREPGRRVATLEQVGQATKAVLVRVSSDGADKPIPYRLNTTVSATRLCEDDGREPDNEPALATPVIPGAFQGVLCPTLPNDAEVDWFVLDVPAEHQVVASLAVDGAGVERATVEIHRRTGGSIQREAWGFETVESISAAPSGGARYWVVVRNLTGRKLAYTLDVDVLPRAPSNDACPADVSELPALPKNASVDGHTLGAVDEQTSSCGGTGGDVFWRLELEEDASVKLKSTAAFDSVLSLRSACEESSEWACRASQTSSNTLAFEGLPAGSYVVRFAGKAGEQGPYTLSTEVTPAPPVPDGVSCETATPLDFTSDVATVSGNLALSSNTLPAACGTDGGDAFWAFTLLENRRVRAWLDGFEGGSVSLVSAAGCGVDSVTSCEAISSVQSGALLERYDVPAGDWVLVVDGGTARAGAFNLRVELSEALSPPTNDDCGSVVGLLDGVTSADTRGTRNDFAPTCGAATHSAGDAVWRLTVASGEEDVELKLDAAFDGVIAVTEGPCGSGAVLACESGSKATVLLPGLGIGEYYVWVDGYSAGEGPFTLTTTRLPPTPMPANDVCALAEPLGFSSGPEVLRSGSTLRAGNDLEPTACAPAPAGMPLSVGGPDVSYRVAVPAGRTLDATLTPEDFDGALYVLESCDQNSCLAASDASFSSGGTEHVSVRNDGPETVEWIVVVDSFTTGPRGRGSFTVRFKLDE